MKPNRSNAVATSGMHALGMISNTSEIKFMSADGNLMFRTDALIGKKEWFNYDSQNRLTGWETTAASASEPTYQDRIQYTGNTIAYKENAGDYNYGAFPQHSPISIGNIPVSTTNATCSYSYLYRTVDSRPRLNAVTKGGNAIYFEYGTADELVKKTSIENNNSSITYYALGGKYELRIDSAGNQTSLSYLGNGVVKYDAPGYTNDKVLYLLKDHLGSVVKVIAINGSSVNTIESFSFDVWGNRRNPSNWTYSGVAALVYIFKGFTGHEHLDAFGLIHAKGRVYDPVRGMFLSPDPYVQNPEGTQGFNRYLYCNGNPVMYVDEDGEFWHLIIGAIIGGVVNVISNHNNIENFWQGFGYFAIGAVAGAASAGIGAGVNVAMAGGSFGAGFMGTAVGVSSTGFIAGAATGAAAGFTSGFVTNSGNAWMGGANFGEGLWSGVKGGGIGALAGGLLGGTVGGIDALTKGANFWTGNATFDLSNGYGASGTFEIGEKTITGKYVGKFEDVNVFESVKLGNYYGDDGYSGVTIPERGIIVGKGVYTSGMKSGQAMMQHEYGHILQYRMIGSKAYYSVIAPESLTSVSLSQISSWDHNTFWTETWANYLSKGYFGSNWLGRFYPLLYPAQNLSTFNLIRLLIIR